MLREKATVLTALVFALAAAFTFAGGGAEGGAGWTRLGAKELPPDGTWWATYAMPIMDGVDMAMLHTFVIRGRKAASNKVKQTLSGANVNAIWPALKRSYETPGLVPGTHRVNDSEHSIETTYDPNDPIYSGAAYEGNEDSAQVFINAARNRLRIVINGDGIPDIIYVKQ